jgi:hypothetical protein
MSILQYSRSNLILNNFKKSICLLNRFLTTTEDESFKIKKTYESEDVPPIPPYKGYPGDNFTRAPGRIKKVSSNFKYGYFNKIN